MFYLNRFANSGTWNEWNDKLNNAVVISIFFDLFFSIFQYMVRMHEIWCSLLEFVTVVNEEDAADGNLWKNDTKQKVYRVQGADIRCIILHFNYGTKCSAERIQFYPTFVRVWLNWMNCLLWHVVCCRVENVLQLVPLKESLWKESQRIKTVNENAVSAVHINTLSIDFVYFHPTFQK